MPLRFSTCRRRLLVSMAQPVMVLAPTSLPDGFLDDLPKEDQDAITAVIGVPISLVGYDEDGRAELEFAETARPGHHVTIWVDAKHIRAYR